MGTQITGTQSNLHQKLLGFGPLFFDRPKLTFKKNYKKKLNTFPLGDLRLMVIKLGNYKGVATIPQMPQMRYAEAAEFDAPLS